MGHHLGLLHTFSAGSCSEFSGDHVDDTPLEKSANFGCSELRDTCTSDAGKDPIWSFMDYTPDQCMNRFSFGQVLRMQSLIPKYKPILHQTSLMSSPCYLKTKGSYCNDRGHPTVTGTANPTVTGTNKYCVCVCENMYTGYACQTLKSIPATVTSAPSSQETTSTKTIPATVTNVENVIFEKAPLILLVSATSVSVRVRYCTFYTPIILRVVLFYRKSDGTQNIAGVFRGCL